jgi:hypothetical protein
VWNNVRLVGSALWPIRARPPGYSFLQKSSEKSLYSIVSSPPPGILPDRGRTVAVESLGDFVQAARQIQGRTRGVAMA